jgi:hypothetical protein
VVEPTSLEPAVAGTFLPVLPGRRYTTSTDVTCRSGSNGEAESGTVEEIERCIEAGKPVLLYFSSKPVVLDSVDQDEYARLTRVRDDFKERGLVDRFESEEELYRKATAALTKTIRKQFAPLLAETAIPTTDAATRAVILARIDRQREIRGFSPSGNPQYTTRERLVIENSGSATAENLTFTVEVPEGKNKPTIAKDEGPIGRLPPGGAVDYPMMTTFGTASQWDIVFHWTEGDTQHEARQTMS